MGKMKKTDYNQCLQGLEDLELPYTAGGNVKRQALLKNSLAVS